MGFYDNAPSGDSKIVYLFSDAAKPEAAYMPPLYPFLKYAMALQAALVDYNLNILKAAANCAREIADSLAPIPVEKFIVADKGWLSQHAGYAPFGPNLETEGYHEFASYTSSIETGDGGALLPAKFVYWMNVVQGGNHIQIFHGDSNARIGSLLELVWKEEAEAFAVAFYDIKDQTPTAVESQHIRDKTCALLSNLVGAINHQNRQIYDRIHSDIPLHRAASAHLHLVS